MYQCLKPPPIITNYHKKNQTLSDTTEKIGQQNVRSRIFNFITQLKKNQIEKCKNLKIQSLRNFNFKPAPLIKHSVQKNESSSNNNLLPQK